MQLVHNGLDDGGVLGLRRTAGSMVEPGFGEDKSHVTPPWLLVIGTTGMKLLYVSCAGNAKSLGWLGFFAYPIRRSLCSLSSIVQ